MPIQIIKDRRYNDTQAGIHISLLAPGLPMSEGLQDARYAGSIDPHFRPYLKVSSFDHEVSVGDYWFLVVRKEIMTSK